MQVQVVAPVTLRAYCDGAVFAEQTTGRAPTVVALHGWGRTRADLSNVLDGRQSIALDLPGFGASPPPPDVWGGEEYATSVASVLDEANLGPYVLLGHSFGGRVAACLAATRPDLVQAVIFLGVPLLRLTPPVPPPWWYRALRAAYRRGLVPDSTMERVRARRGSADYNAAHGVMRDVLVRAVNETYEDQLARIQCPVGFCWGANDTAAPVEIARRAKELVPNCAAFEIVDGAGHDVHLDAPDAVRRVLDTVAVATIT